MKTLKLLFYAGIIMALCSLLSLCVKDKERDALQNKGYNHSELPNDINKLDTMVYPVTPGTPADPEN